MIKLKQLSRLYFFRGGISHIIHRGGGIISQLRLPLELSLRNLICISTLRYKPQINKYIPIYS